MASSVLTCLVMQLLQALRALRHIIIVTFLVQLGEQLGGAPINGRDIGGVGISGCDLGGRWGGMGGHGLSGQSQSGA